MTFGRSPCKIFLDFEDFRYRFPALPGGGSRERGCWKVTNRQKGVLMAVLGPSLWGIMGIFVRDITSTGISVVGVSFFRCAVSGLLLLAFFAVQKRSVLQIGWKGRIICALYGIVSYSLGFVAYSISVSRIPVAVATILMFLCPVWVTLFSTLIFRDRPDRQKILSIVVCLVGAVLAADLLSVGNVRLDLIGMLMGIFNGMSAAMQIVIPRYFAGQYSRDSMLVYGFLGAAVALLFFTSPLEIITAFREYDALRLAGSIFAVSALCTMVANVAFTKSAEYIDGTESSILSALEVVVGSLAGYLVYHEHLTALQILGMVLVVAGSLGTQIHWGKFLRRKV